MRRGRLVGESVGRCDSFMGLDAEIALLLACISPTGTATLIDGRFNGRSVDWMRFVKLATNHHVIPLVYHALKHEPSLPNDVRGQLRHDRMQIAAHSVRAAYVLQRLQRRAAGQGIELIPVKGPALAILAHGRGRESMRQFEDLDIVVRYDDLLHAIQWLESEGYVLRDELVSTAMRCRYLATKQDWGLRKPDDPLHLEVKPTLVWHTLCGLEVADYLAASCRPLPVDERHILKTPGPEAMLIAVCVDGVQDMWSKFSAVADVGHLLNAWPDANWAQLLDDATATGQRRSLVVGVSVAEHLLHCHIPEPLKKAAAQDTLVEQLVGQVAFRIRSHPEAHPGFLELFLFMLRTRERFRDRWRFVSRLLFVPSLVEIQDFPLPPMLFSLYALFRPLRLAWDVLCRGNRRRSLG